MSGTLPTTPKFKNIELSGNHINLTTQMEAGGVQRVGLTGHFYTARADYPTMTIKQAKPVLGFLNAQKGSLDSFSVLIHPYENSSGAVYTQHIAHTGSINTDLTASTSYAVGAKTINYTSNFTSSYYNSGTDGDFFIVGDFVKFSNHNKLYQVTAQTNPNSSGAGQIQIEPGLVTAITNSHTITYHTIYGTFFLGTDSNTWATGTEQLVQLGLNLREDV